MAEALDIAGGIGEGLSKALPNLLQAARDQRAQSNFEKKFELEKPGIQAESAIKQAEVAPKQALSQQAIDQMARKKKEDETNIPMEEIEKRMPGMKHFREALVNMGSLQGNETELSITKLKEKQQELSTPQGQPFWMAAVQKWKQETIQQSGIADNVIAEKEKTIKDLTEKYPNIVEALKVDPKADIQKLDGGEQFLKAQKALQEAQKAKEPISQHRNIAANMEQQIKKVMGYTVLGQGAKLTDNQIRDIAANSDDEGLKKMAQKMLDLRQTQGVPTEYKTFYQGFKKRNPNADDMDISNAWQELKTKLQQSRYGKFMQIPSLPGMAFNRYTNEMEPMKLPSGVNLENLTTQVAANKAYQNQKKQYEATMQVVNSAALDKDTLLKTSDNFKRSDYPAPNAVMNWTAKQFGSQERQKEYAQFETALLAFSRKYMRVVTGAARSVAELSVGAQKASDIISKFDSWDVLQARVNQAQKEIDNEQKGYLNGMDALKAEVARFGNTSKTDGASQKSDPLGLR